MSETSDRAPMMSNRPEEIGPERGKFPSGTLLFWLAAALAGVVLLVVVMNMPPRQVAGEGSEHPLVGQPLAVSLAPLTGDPPPLDKESLAGKVTLINFWGTWCPPCRMEFPHVVALWEKLKDRDDFQLAAVSCLNRMEKDVSELSATEKFLENQGTQMPTYWDPQGRTRLAFMQLDPNLVFPTTILLDRSGIIRGVWAGYYPGMEENVEATVRSVLDET